MEISEDDLPNIIFHKLKKCIKNFPEIKCMFMGLKLTNRIFVVCKNCLLPTPGRRIMGTAFRKNDGRTKFFIFYFLHSLRLLSQVLFTAKGMEKRDG